MGIEYLQLGRLLQDIERLELMVEKNRKMNECILTLLYISVSMEHGGIWENGIEKKKMIAKMRQNLKEMGLLE